MLIHDWTRVDPGIFRAFHHEWADPRRRPSSSRSPWATPCLTCRSFSLPVCERAAGSDLPVGLERHAHVLARRAERGVALDSERTPRDGAGGSRTGL